MSTQRAEAGGEGDEADGRGAGVGEETSQLSEVDERGAEQVPPLSLSFRVYLLFSVHHVTQ